MVSPQTVYAMQDGMLSQFGWSGLNNNWLELRLRSDLRGHIIINLDAFLNPFSENEFENNVAAIILAPTKGVI